mgnify:CR=1 FL=1
MYLNNKYARCYFNIVRKAKSRASSRKEAKSIVGYVEKHHIIPKAFGGNDETTNIVYLTAREHFVCHLLLTKMVDGKFKYQMDKAVHIMTIATTKHHRCYKITSRTFEMVRKNAAVAHSNLTKGKPKSAEHKKILSLRATGRVSPNKGVPMSETQKTKMRVIAAQRPILKCPHCDKSMTYTNYSRWHGDKCKNK